MTSPDPTLPQARREVATELAGLIVGVIGALGLGYAALHVDAAVLIGLISTLAIVAGLSLLTRTEE